MPTAVPLTHLRGTSVSRSCCIPKSWPARLGNALFSPGTGPCGYRDGHSWPKLQLGRPTRVPSLGRAPAVPQAFSSLPTLPGSAPAPAGCYRSARSVSITRSLNVLSSQAGLSIDLLGGEPLPFMLLLPPVPGKAQLGRPLAAPPSFSSSCCTSQQPRQRPALQSPALGAGATRPWPAVGLEAAEPFLSCLRLLVGQTRPAGGIPTRGATSSLLRGSRGPIFPGVGTGSVLSTRADGSRAILVAPSPTPWGHPPGAAPRRFSQLITPPGRGDDILAPAKTNTAPSKHAGLGKPRASAIHHGSPLGCTGQSLPLAAPRGWGGGSAPQICRVKGGRSLLLSLLGVLPICGVLRGRRFGPQPLGAQGGTPGGTARPLACPQAESWPEPPPGS